MSEIVTRNITKAIKTNALHQEILAVIVDFEGMATHPHETLSDTTVFEFHFLTAPDETQLDLVIASHDANVTTKEALIAVYIQREIDGLEYFRSVRADLALLYLAGTITVANAFYIEEKLDHVKSKVISGDWLTAQHEITNVVVTGGVVSQDDIDNGYTQEVHDGIKNYIDNYVTENYS